LAQDKVTVQQLTEEAANINSFLAQLAETRAAETAAFHTRVDDQNAMIEGLDEVIDLFGTEAASNSDIDAATAQQVLDLLRQIRASLVASIAEDTSAEATADSKYHAFVDEQNARLATIAADLESLRTEIANLETEITSLVDAIAAEEIKRDNAAALKSQTEAALATLEANYQANKVVRSDQHTLIQAVEDRLSNNTDSQAQEFLNNA